MSLDDAFIVGNSRTAHNSWQFSNFGILYRSEFQLNIKQTGQPLTIFEVCSASIATRATDLIRIHENDNG